MLLMRIDRWLYSHLHVTLTRQEEKEIQGDFFFSFT